MKKIDLPVLLVIIAATFFTVGAKAQNPYSINAVTQQINTLCGGYYEFLPEGYNTNVGNYPLLIDIHGMGGQGSGSQEDLPKILNFNSPYFINRNLFPKNFVLNEESFSFVVIAPQFSATATAGDVKDVLDFVIAHYKIDTSRMYVTGYSRGGEPTWRYACASVETARRIAALVPVAGVNTDPAHKGVENIVTANLPVWALHSVNDEGTSTSVNNSINFVAAINNLEPETPAEFTALTGTHNQTWANVYNPEAKFSIGGESLNIYEWMLTHKREAIVLPISLINFSVVLLPDNSVSINWTTDYERNNKHFIVERSPDEATFNQLGTVPSTNLPAGDDYAWNDKSPLHGDNYYRISHSDSDGTTKILGTLKLSLKPEPVTVTAYPNPLDGSLLNLKFTGKLYQLYKVSIYDVQGRILFSGQYRVSSDNIQVNPTQLASGLNIIKIEGADLKKTIFLINR